MIFIIILPIILQGQLCPQGQFQYWDTCYNCPPNCLSCLGKNIQGYPCTQCENIQCNYCPLYNCEVCFFAYDNCKCQCSQCKNNLVLVDGQCSYQCDNSCSICLPDQSCICKFGMYKRDEQCYHCNDYCLNCFWNYQTEQNECSRCQDYYYQDIYGNCNPCDPGCKNCVQNDKDLSLYCTNCENQNYLLNGQCLQCSSWGCIDCEYDGTEVKCLKEKIKCQIKEVPNCNLCEVDLITSQNKCSECLQGYFENFGLCEACQSPCATCKTKIQCLTCQQDGYYQDQGQNCIACSHPCKTCNGPLEINCTTCVHGYFQSSNSCYTIQNKFWILLFISILSIYIFQLIRQICKYTQQRYTQIRIDN